MFDFGAKSASFTGDGTVRVRLVGGEVVRLRLWVGDWAKWAKSAIWAHSFAVTREKNAPIAIQDLVCGLQPGLNKILLGEMTWI